MTQAHKVSLEPRDEVDVGKLAVLASLVDEQDGAAPFDLDDDGVVAEFHRPTNPRVEFGERRLGPDYMVCFSRVDDSSLVLMLLAPLADLSKHSLLL